MWSTSEWGQEGPFLTLDKRKKLDTHKINGGNSGTKYAADTCGVSFWFFIFLVFKENVGNSGFEIFRFKVPTQVDF